MMKKKAIKKLLAALLAVAMLCAMAVPVMAASAKDQTHSFTAYQIFSGTNSTTEGDTALGNIQWGSGINAESFLTALQADKTIGGDFAGIEFTDANCAQKVAAIVAEKYTDNSANATIFARIAYANKTDSSATGTGTVSISAAGYYLFVDTTAFDADATDSVFGLALLKVAKNNSTVTPTVKAAQPTVTKDVYDNDDGSQQSNSDTNNAFGKSADHAINESFQFKLTAEIPANDNFGAYNQYKVIFHDSMSKGITFESLASVKITSNGTTTDVTDSAVKTITDGTAGAADWTLTIDDIKTAVLGIDLKYGATIEVIYNAHLNEDAYVNTTNGPTTNQNTVYLEYSNNPNAGSEASTGKTPEETVYVFTYQITNTKYKNDVDDANKLAGAKFRLYSDEACENEVLLYLNTDGFYYPVKSGTNAVEMVSNDKGEFNIKGLDAGVYYLRETGTPDGFNTCEDIKIVINASHQRTADQNSNVDLTGSENMANNVINRTGATLPSTGGIGTTIFYVVGGGLMVAAVVLLVTKKRMENK